MPELNQCDKCGSYSSIPVDERDIYQEPENSEYEHLCRDCHEAVNVHTPEDMTDAELIAAIMDDSLGYADPHHAEGHVEAFRDGDRFAYCERATACFPADPEDFDADDRAALTGHRPGDLRKLMESARRHWLALPDSKREKLQKFAELWAEAEDPGEISSISMAYPTLGV